MFEVVGIGRDSLPAAIWLYLRFTLSLRDDEDLLAERFKGAFLDARTAARALSRRSGLAAFSVAG